MKEEKQISPDDLYTRIKESLGNANLDTSTLGNLKGDIDTIYGMLKTKIEESKTDHLTQLPNYWGLIEILEKEKAGAERRKEHLALAFIDFNELTKYNDNYGHIQANHAIKMVAGTIKDSVRGGDAVARYGGDEFCLVMSNANYKEAKKVIGRVVNAINKLSIDSVVGELPDNSYKDITVSIGYTVLGEGEDILSALDRANKAEHIAKEAYRGKDRKANRVRSAKKKS